MQKLKGLLENALLQLCFQLLLSCTCKVRKLFHNMSFQGRSELFFPGKRQSATNPDDLRRVHFIFLRRYGVRSDENRT